MCFFGLALSLMIERTSLVLLLYMYAGQEKTKGKWNFEILNLFRLWSPKSTYALLDVKSRALQEGAQQLVGIPGAWVSPAGMDVKGCRRGRFRNSGRIICPVESPPISPEANFRRTKERNANKLYVLYYSLVSRFLSAAKPADQGEKSVVLLVEVGGLFSNHPCTLKKGASRVHLFLLLFFGMGVHQLKL